MGADGGTIPTRIELVKLKKKPVRLEKNVELEVRWQNCALTAQPLKEPVVACALGRLYNKEAIIQFLLDKEKYADQAAAVMHIRGLKDVVTLKLTANKHADKEGKATTAGAYTDVNTARFACPVTDLPMNGHYRFCYLRGCGCVLSEKALREIPSETCHKCGAACSGDDAVVINPSKDEEDDMWAQLVAQRKVKPTKKEKRKADDSNGNGDGKKARKASNEIQGSAAYKSLFLTEDKKKQMQQGESFTARAVHRAYIA